MHGYVIDWNAIAALATAAAVIVALWQAALAKQQVREQLTHQNDMERKRIEQEYLLRVLDVVHDPFHSAQNFYFEAARVLSTIPANMNPAPAAVRPLQAAMAQAIEETKEYDRIAGNYVDILGAFSERYDAEKRASDAATLRAIMTNITEVVNATGDLRELLASEETIRSVSPDQFGNLQVVEKARNACDAASKMIARRLASLYA